MSLNLPGSDAADGTDQVQLDGNGARMTLVEHLDELRGRLITSAIILVVTTGLALIFTGRVIELLRAPLPPGVRLIYTAPMEMLATYFKVALYVGIVFAMPVLLYELVAFISPAMTPKEKRYFFTLLPGVFVCFAGGVLFGFEIVLPNMLPYLLGFFMEIADPLLRIGEYISFVSTFLFWLGISFQTPLVIFLLAKLNIVDTQRLTKMRKYAFLAAFVLAAIITPTPDPINQTIVALPIYLLFEIGILLVRFA